MNDRWIMNRMGFVNFWLYDEETFSFADGKIFLRGANASGKSITTQSFIPFILDGNRNPARLDPFGSKDRKMEYYFLGDGEKEDSTGYIFLEFKKRGSEQYRTIGIGQRARKGQDMLFWGFVVLDGRRVGVDFNLYRKLGMNKLPLSMQELENILNNNEGNFIVKKPGEYKDLVNKYIFKFPRIEQYDQLIKILIKVRAPKLSKDFRPIETYAVLNDSLQTLSDDDMQAMVESMEKMEDIRAKLEDKERALKDVKIISKEYARYNSFMLTRKAQVYLDAKRAADTLREKVRQCSAAIAENQQAYAALNKANKNLQDLLEALKKERAALEWHGLYDKVQHLADTKSECQKAAAEKAVLGTVIQDKDKLIKNFYLDIEKFSRELETKKYSLTKLFKELTELNAMLLTDFKLQNLQDMLDADSEKRAELRNCIYDYRKKIAVGLLALQQMRKAETDWSKLEEEYQNLLTDKFYKGKNLSDAEALENSSRDELINAYYTLQSAYQEIIIVEHNLQSIINCIKVYQDVKDQSIVSKITNALYLERKTALRQTEAKHNDKKAELLNALKTINKEIDELKNMPLPVPPRREAVTAARNILALNNISCWSFYETLDFAEEVTENAKKQLEAQLQDTGLLDALVVLPEDMERAKALLADLSDALLLPRRQDAGSREKVFTALVPAGNNPEINAWVQKILDSIAACEDEEAEIVLSPDGYFRQGIIYGHSIGEAEPAYIGAEARKEQLRRLLAAKEAEKDSLQQQLAANDLDIAAVKKHLQQLETEFKQIPPFDDLDNAISMRKEAAAAYKYAERVCAEMERARENLLQQKRQCEQCVLQACQKLPFKRTVEDYEKASSNIDNYGRIAESLFDELSEYEKDNLRLLNVRNRTISEESLRAEKISALQKTESNIKALKTEIKAVEEFLDRPDIEKIVQRLRDVVFNLERAAAEFHANEKEMVRYDEKIKKEQEDLEQEKLESAAKDAEENKTAKYFEEELNLKFVFPPADVSLQENAERALKCAKASDRERSVSDIASSMSSSFHQHNSALLDYRATLEELFEDDPDCLRRRQHIVFSALGKKYELGEFALELQNEIDTIRLLLQKEDRKLFEDILSDTLSKKLKNRISESRNWIHNMSEMMQNLDTSMGLTFSLAWRARAADSETELDVKELEKVLSKDKQLLTNEDINKVTRHFQSKIEAAKALAEIKDETLNYADLVRDALDYRKWFEFQMYYARGGAAKKLLTNNAFNTFSGGEKAMAMYVPLFAAVHAQYEKADSSETPRIMALDEAFAGVDDKNISSMFALVQELDLDYIMNSQVLWGCYSTVKNLRIAELLKPPNSDTVTVINYSWNGVKRELYE